MSMMRLPLFCVLSLAAAAAGCSSPDDGSGPADSTPDSPETEPEGPKPPVNPALPRAPGEPAPPPEPELTGCGVKSGFPGDEYCILPPPEGQGFQLHYGPSDYDDPDEVAKYLMEAGAETNDFIPITATNTEDIFFYGRQYRMRPHSHHLIVSEPGGTGSFLGTGRRLGGTQNSAKDNPVGGSPPENLGIGMPLKAKAPLLINLHYFNSTDGQILQEVWVNFWYVDAAEVTQEAKEMFLWAQGPPVEPGAVTTVKGKRVITEPGRVLTMYGHRHSNNTRFSAYRTRADVRELVYDDYDWAEPGVLEFNSAVVNPAAGAGGEQGGGHTGPLELLAGDALEWECEIENRHEVPITFGENEAITSEMCILIGDALGPTLLGF